MQQLFKYFLVFFAFLLSTANSREVIQMANLLIDKNKNVLREFPKSSELYLFENGNVLAQHGQEVFYYSIFGEIYWTSKVYFHHHAFFNKEKNEIWTLGFEPHLYKGRRVSFDTIVIFDEKTGRVKREISLFKLMDQIRKYSVNEELEKNLNDPFNEFFKSFFFYSMFLRPEIEILNDRYHFMHHDYVSYEKNEFDEVNSIFDLYGVGRIELEDGIDERLIGVSDYIYLNTNFIQILPKNESAKYNKAFEKGNILISFNFISLVIIVDPEFKKILWTSKEMGLMHQHTPQVLENGQILIYDNGRRGERELTQVFLYDPIQKKKVWIYPKEKNENSFFAPLLGGAYISKEGVVYYNDPSHEWPRLIGVKNDKEVWNYIGDQIGNGYRPTIVDIPEEIYQSLLKESEE